MSGDACTYKIDRILKVLPLLIREQRTPLAITKRNSLVSTILLCAVHGRRIPSETFGHAVESLHGWCGVLLDPRGAHVGAGGVLVVVAVLLIYQ